MKHVNSDAPSKAWMLKAVYSMEDWKQQCLRIHRDNLSLNCSSDISKPEETVRIKLYTHIYGLEPAEISEANKVVRFIRRNAPRLDGLRDSAALRYISAAAVFQYPLSGNYVVCMFHLRTEATELLRANLKARLSPGAVSAETGCHSLWWPWAMLKIKIDRQAFEAATKNYARRR